MIVFAHLLNDSSGSPRVLRSAIAALTLGSAPARLFIGSDGDGSLSDSGVPITRYWYKRTGYRIATLFTYLLSQLLLFFKLLCDRTIDRNAVVYVNTLLPFGAALYGRITGRRVIYHVHEISVSPPPLKFLLTRVAGWTSSLNIYVSDAHMRGIPIKGVRAQRVYNSLDTCFVNKANASSYTHRRNGLFNVLMIASLRDYKGVFELLAAAEALRDLPDIRFELLVNDSQIAIDCFFSKRSLPDNLIVYSNTLDTTPFYSRASLVLNLSLVDRCVETFGMTILEAMAFGIPVIVPPIGGPAELVTDGVEGYLIDSREHSKLCEKIVHLARDSSHCLKISDACRRRANFFSLSNFNNFLVEAIAEVRGARG